jgi:hypothetical protein
MLEIESGISADVIAARAYRTVMSKAELGRLGFSDSQRQTPTLVLPLWNVAGDIALYQSRPDSPRIVNGKPVKYETPRGARIAIDCHPFVRGDLGNPAKPLWLTEGIRKGDALVSHDCVALALIGVWNFRGTNQHGGKSALPDWEAIALNGRIVYIVFDSDVMTKEPVHQALARIKAFLESRGAIVYVIYLPCGDGGQKCGVDDFLIVGHTVDDLVKLATGTLRAPAYEPQSEASHPYRATPEGIVFLRRGENGTEEIVLTNFVAKIEAERVVDNGVEVSRLYDIMATVADATVHGQVTGDQFMRPEQWVPQLLGARAILPPGRARHDMVRQAIQYLSSDAETMHEYAHTGWRLINDEPVYLNGGGGIGRDGPLPGVGSTESPALSNETELCHLSRRARTGAPSGP